MRITFWNVRNMPRRAPRPASETRRLSGLVDRLDADLVVLLECPADSLPVSDRWKNLAMMLPEKFKRQFAILQATNSPVEKIRLIELFPSTPSRQDQLLRLVFLHIEHPQIEPFTLVVIHNWSKREMDPPVQYANLRTLGDKIRDYERQSNERTIVLGDFNANPFDEGVINTDGFCALPHRDIVQIKSRQKISMRDGRYIRMFHNPMWKFYGDIESPSGTFYYAKKPADVNNFWWHFADQIIFRPALLNEVDSASIRVMSEIDGTSLLQSRAGIQIPDARISDHLPIQFDITERSQS